MFIRKSVDEGNQGLFSTGYWDNRRVVVMGLLPEDLSVYHFLRWGAPWNEGLCMSLGFIGSCYNSFGFTCLDLGQS